MEDGKLTALALYIVSRGGEMSKEAAISEMKSWIERQRRELMRIVLQEKSVIPKSVKEIFGHMSSVLHLFYSKDDGYWSMGLLQVATSIIQDPILLDEF